MNFKHFLALFLLISARLGAISQQIDVTQEFCKVTQTPDTICAQLQAFMKTYGRYTEVELRSRVNQSHIGCMELTKRNDAIEIDLLKVSPAFQNQGHGSRLLQFRLAQCVGTCTQVELHAEPFTAPYTEKAQAFKKLKKFYTKHGGQVVCQYYESADIVFRKAEKAKKDDRFLHFLMSYL